MDKLLGIKRGDQRIFAEVFETFYQKTFGFFMIRTHRNGEISGELTQLTYIKLWQTKHTLSEEHSLEKQLLLVLGFSQVVWFP
jgi:DNA-directed RNA polymerase specialized sigma24 family protein